MKCNGKDNRRSFDCTALRSQDDRRWVCVRCIPPKRQKQRRRVDGAPQVCGWYQVLNATAKTTADPSTALRSVLRKTDEGYNWARVFPTHNSSALRSLARRQ